MNNIQAERPDGFGLGAVTDAEIVHLKKKKGSWEAVKEFKCS